MINSQIGLTPHNSTSVAMLNFTQTEDQYLAVDTTDDNPRMLNTMSVERFILNGFVSIQNEHCTLFSGVVGGKKQIFNFQDTNTFQSLKSDDVTDKSVKSLAILKTDREFNMPMSPSLDDDFTKSQNIWECEIDCPDVDSIIWVDVNSRADVIAFNGVVISGAEGIPLDAKLSPNFIDKKVKVWLIQTDDESLGVEIPTSISIEFSYAYFNKKLYDITMDVFHIINLVKYNYVTNIMELKLSVFSYKQHVIKSFVTTQPFNLSEQTNTILSEDYGSNPDGTPYRTMTYYPLNQTGLVLSTDDTVSSYNILMKNYVVELLDFGHPDTPKQFGIFGNAVTKENVSKSKVVTFKTFYDNSGVIKLKNNQFMSIDKVIIRTVGSTYDRDYLCEYDPITESIIIPYRIDSSLIDVRMTIIYRNSFIDFFRVEYNGLIIDDFNQLTSTVLDYYVIGVIYTSDGGYFSELVPLEEVDSATINKFDILINYSLGVITTCDVLNTKFVTHKNIKGINTHRFDFDYFPLASIQSYRINEKLINEVDDSHFPDDPNQRRVVDIIADQSIVYKHNIILDDSTINQQIEYTITKEIKHYYVLITIELHNLDSSLGVYLKNENHNMETFIRLFEPIPGEWVVDTLEPMYFDKSPVVKSFSKKYVLGINVLDLPKDDAKYCRLRLGYFDTRLHILGTGQEIALMDDDIFTDSVFSGRAYGDNLYGGNDV